MMDRSTEGRERDANTSVGLGVSWWLQLVLWLALILAVAYLSYKFNIPIDFGAWI